MSFSSRSERFGNFEKIVEKSGVLPVSLSAFTFVIIWLLLFQQINVLFSNMLATDAPAWEKSAFYALLFLELTITVGVGTAFYWRLGHPAQGQVTTFEKMDFAKETFKRRRFRYKIISEDIELERVNELTMKIFGDNHPDFDRIRQIFARNNLKSVVLVEYKAKNQKSTSANDRQGYAFLKTSGVGEIRGFSSVWPLTDEAGELMATGRLPEEQIAVEEVLPKHENTTAKYLYITGIADLGSRRWHSEAASHEVGSSVTSAIMTVGLLDLMSTEFFKDGHERNVIMIRHSPEGGNLIHYFIKRLPQERVRVEHIIQDGKPSTVTTARVTAEHIRLARELLLRRLAGVQENLYSYADGKGFWYGDDTEH